MTTARLLSGLNVVELSQGIAGPFCGKLLADLGADVIKVEPPAGDRTRQAGPFPGDELHPEKSGLFLALNTNKRSLVLDVAVPSDRSRLRELLVKADVAIWGDGATGRMDNSLPVEELRRLNPRAVLTSVTPFGRTGPLNDYRGSDLVIFQMSGYAPLVPGGVTDLAAEPPLRAGGQQSEFVTGLSAATGTMMALALRDLNGSAGLVDVSAWESMAMMPQSSFVDAALGQAPRSRLKSVSRMNAVVAILPTEDGYVAISPREDHQWAAWLEIMGQPEWREEERFTSRRGRQDNWSELEPLLVAWTRHRGKQEIYRACQEAHVPAFPVNSAADLLSSSQMIARGFFEDLNHPVAGPLPYASYPFKLSTRDLQLEQPAPLLGEHPAADFSQAPAVESPRKLEARLPLDGVRVLDFSWIIAGPTCTRMLGLMGADVIKVESRRRPDPTRNGTSHVFLNQSKRSLSLNISTERGLSLAKELAAQCDVVVENYATGVIERMGLSYEALKEVNPSIIMLSSSGLGHTGPDKDHVAYGSLLQSFTGWSGQTGYPGGLPLIGGVWSDPLTGMMQTFLIATALRHRQHTGEGMYIDLAMAEAMCTLLPEAFMDYAMNGRGITPNGNRDRRYAPHNLYRCTGADAWVAVAVTNDDEWHALCIAIGQPELANDPRFRDFASRLRNADAVDEIISSWTKGMSPEEAVSRLQPNVPSGISLNASGALKQPHLQQRGFFIDSTGPNGEGIRLPGVPWHMDGLDPRAFRAEDLGESNRDVLREQLGLSDAAIEELEAQGVLH